MSERCDVRCTEQHQWPWCSRCATPVPDTRRPSWQRTALVVAALNFFIMTALAVLLLADPDYFITGGWRSWSVFAQPETVTCAVQ